MKALKILSLAALAVYQTAHADTFPGPVTAHVLRVIDGDTLEVEAPIWPQQWVRTAVRIAGIDAPEIRRQSIDCEDELVRGFQAKDRVEELLDINISPIPPIVSLTDIELDKFGGRHVAVVTMENGQTIGTRLLLEDLALPWDGRGRTPNHCQ